MTEELQLKIKEHFSQMAILRNQVSASSLFAGRNLPSFVMDFVTKRYLNSMGEINGLALSQFLDTVIPKKATSVKDRLGSGQEVMLMTRFNVYIDLISVC